MSRTAPAATVQPAAPWRCGTWGTHGTRGTWGTARHTWHPITSPVRYSRRRGSHPAERLRPAAFRTVDTSLHLGPLQSMLLGMTSNAVRRETTRRVVRA